MIVLVVIAALLAIMLTPALLPLSESERDARERRRQTLLADVEHRADFERAKAFYAAQL